MDVESNYAEPPANHTNEREFQRRFAGAQTCPFGELGTLPPLPLPLSDLYAQAVAYATEASDVMAAA